jgi:hypothetical protein
MSLRRARVVMVVIGLAAAVLVSLAWLHQQLEMDRCLDGGGCWDRRRGVCEHHDRARCEP